MAIVVSAPNSDDVYEQATFITVIHDGHLLVGTSDSNPAIAIYAPGSWEHAKVK